MTRIQLPVPGPALGRFSQDRTGNSSFGAVQGPSLLGSFRVCVLGNLFRKVPYRLRGLIARKDEMMLRCRSNNSFTWLKWSDVVCTTEALLGPLHKPLQVNQRYGVPPSSSLGRQESHCRR
jgi:hypothetical protein